jgi:rare lipoprotein A
MTKIYSLLFILISSTFITSLFAQNHLIDSSNVVAIDSSKNIKENDIVSDTLSTIKPIVIDNIEKKGKFFYGVASFYSSNLEGSETSTQERFSHKKFTAASNRFKLNTWLRVTNISNNKSIIVRVNDRMHPRMDAKGRIVDLSYIGAKNLDFISKGITKVKVEIVDKNTKK